MSDPLYLVPLIILVAFVVTLVAWGVFYDHPQKPFILKHGKVQSPPTLYGTCPNCGCIFSARLKDCGRTPRHEGGGYDHPCPTERCYNRVRMTDVDPMPGRIKPPVGGSGTAPPRGGSTMSQPKEKKDDDTRDDLHFG